MDSLERPAYTVSEQIEKLTRSGVVFEKYSLANAIEYLTDCTYFFKIKAFDDSFVKLPNGKYANLDFALLKDIASIDHHLRTLLFNLSADIEHAVRIRFNQILMQSADDYRVLPAFYVRMNQVLLLSRFERIFCHLAGLWTNLCIVCVVIIGEYAGYSPMSIVSATYVFLTMLVMNLLPILNTDGQKVLTTLLNVEKPKNIKSAGIVLKIIHYISIIAAAIIVLRFCVSLVLLFRVS